jgi:pimeloyl-ACP methyl ester carboxylesterase
MKKIIIYRFRIILVLLFFFIIYKSFGQVKTENFTFENNGKILSGFIDLPENSEASSLIIIIHGSGPTNIANSWGHNIIREAFVRQGITVCLWDKQGCGESQGVYDDDQTVQSSAQEVLTAINKLQKLKISGSNKIGLFSGSRGGWVAPLVIEQLPSIAFWISMSGPDDKDNSIYKLGSNLKVMGKSESEVELLMEERKAGNRVFWKGGTYEEYQEVTKNLNQDSVYIALDGAESETNYIQLQQRFLGKGYVFDNESGMLVMVPNLREILTKIQCPVLALFGEKDTQLDWQSTFYFYEETLGVRENSTLTIKTFPNCNHSMQKCKTGGMYENLNTDGLGGFCDGFFETMTEWLKEQGFGK